MRISGSLARLVLTSAYEAYRSVVAPAFSLLFLVKVVKNPVDNGHPIKLTITG